MTTPSLFVAIPPRVGTSAAEERTSAGMCLSNAMTRRHAQRPTRRFPYSTFGLAASESGQHSNGFRNRLRARPGTSRTLLQDLRFQPAVPPWPSSVEPPRPSPLCRPAVGPPCQFHADADKDDQSPYDLPADSGNSGAATRSTTCVVSVRESDQSPYPKRNPVSLFRSPADDR